MPGNGVEFVKSKSAYYKRYHPNALDVMSGDEVVGHIYKTRSDKDSEHLGHIRVPTMYRLTSVLNLNAGGHAAQEFKTLTLAKSEAKKLWSEDEASERHGENGIEEAVEEYYENKEEIARIEHEELAMFRENFNDETLEPKNLFKLPDVEPKNSQKESLEQIAKADDDPPAAKFELSDDEKGDSSKNTKKESVTLFKDASAVPATDKPGKFFGRASKVRTGGGRGKKEMRSK